MAIKNMKKLLWSRYIVAAAICFTLALYFFVYSNNNKTIPTGVITRKQEQQNISTITTPTPTIVVSNTGKIPTVTLSQTPTIAAILTPTASPTVAPTTVPAQTPTITVSIHSPGGTASFTLPFTTGSTPCSVLTDAKNQGKISSVTIMHYGAPLNSDYVKEINNYSDNWTFAQNGTSKPKGCSNYTLSSGDNVTWRYN